MTPDTGRLPPTLVPMLLLSIAILMSVIASNGPIQWTDNGALLADAAQGRFFSESLGAHPLYHTVSTLFQALFGSRALSLLNSMLLVPLAWLVVRLAASVGATPRQALLAAAATVLSHAVFWVSTKAEVYLLHTLLVLLAYWLHLGLSKRLSVSRTLLSIGLVTGLAACVDPLTFVVLLPLYVQLLIQHRARVLLTLPGFLLGCVAAYPAVVHELRAGMGLLDIGRSYLTDHSVLADGNDWTANLLRFDVLWHEKNALCVLLLSLIGPSLLGLLPPATRSRWLLWSAAILNLVFAVSYNVFDRFTLFLPGIALLSILGVLQLRKSLPRKPLGNSVLNL